MHAAPCAIGAPATAGLRLRSPILLRLRFPLRLAKADAPCADGCVERRPPPFEDVTLPGGSAVTALAAFTTAAPHGSGSPWRAARGAEAVARGRKHQECLLYARANDVHAFRALCRSVRLRPSQLASWPAAYPANVRTCDTTPVRRNATRRPPPVAVCGMARRLVGRWVAEPPGPRVRPSEEGSIETVLLAVALPAQSAPPAELRAARGRRRVIAALRAALTGWAPRVAPMSASSPPVAPGRMQASVLLGQVGPLPPDTGETNSEPSGAWLGPLRHRSGGATSAPAVGDQASFSLRLLSPIGGKSVSTHALARCGRLRWQLTPRRCAAADGGWVVRASTSSRAVSPAGGEVGGTHFAAGSTPTPPGSHASPAGTATSTPGPAVHVADCPADAACSPSGAAASGHRDVPTHGTWRAHHGERMPANGDPTVEPHTPPRSDNAAFRTAHPPPSYPSSTYVPPLATTPVNRLQPIFASSMDASHVAVGYGRTVATLSHMGMLELEIDGVGAAAAPFRLLAHGGGADLLPRLALLLPPRGLLLLSMNAAAAEKGPLSRAASTPPRRSAGTQAAAVAKGYPHHTTALGASGASRIFGGGTDEGSRGVTKPGATGHVHTGPGSAATATAARVAVDERSSRSGNDETSDTTRHFAFNLRQLKAHLRRGTARSRRAPTTHAAGGGMPSGAGPSVRAGQSLLECLLDPIWCAARWTSPWASPALASAARQAAPTSQSELPPRERTRLRALVQSVQRAVRWVGVRAAPAHQGPNTVHTPPTPLWWFSNAAVFPPSYFPPTRSPAPEPTRPPPPTPQHSRTRWYFPFGPSPARSDLSTDIPQPRAKTRRGAIWSKMWRPRRAEPPLAPDPARSAPGGYDAQEALVGHLGRGATGSPGPAAPSVHAADSDEGADAWTLETATLPRLEGLSRAEPIAMMLIPQPSAARIPKTVAAQADDDDASECDELVSDHTKQIRDEGAPLLLLLYEGAALVSYNLSGALTSNAHQVRLAHG